MPPPPLLSPLPLPLPPSWMLNWTRATSYYWVQPDAVSYTNERREVVELTINISRRGSK